MRPILRHDGPLALTAAVLATSAVVGLAGHWFAAWLLMLVGSSVFAAWTLRENERRRRALQAARTELAQVRDQQRTLKTDLDRARREARSVQQEVRADLELLRAEVAVASDPDDPEDRPGG